MNKWCSFGCASEVELLLCCIQLFIGQIRLTIRRPLHESLGCTHLSEEDVRKAPFKQIVERDQREGARNP